MSALLLLALLCQLGPAALAATNNATEVEALLEFKAGLTNSDALANWDPELSVCGWTGVSCGTISDNTTQVSRL